MCGLNKVTSSTAKLLYSIICGLVWLEISFKLYQKKSYNICMSSYTNSNCWNTFTFACSAGMVNFKSIVYIPANIFKENLFGVLSFFICLLNVLQYISATTMKDIWELSINVSDTSLSTCWPNIHFVLLYGLSTKSQVERSQNPYNRSRQNHYITKYSKNKNTVCMQPMNQSII